MWWAWEKEGAAWEAERDAGEIASRMLEKATWKPTNLEVSQCVYTLTHTHTLNFFS